MLSTLAKGIGVLALAAALAWLVGVAVLGHAGLLALVFGAPQRPRIDFASLERTSRPNQYLVCPPATCAATVDRDSPVFAVPAGRLRDAFLKIVAGQPRVRLLTADAEAGYYEFEQQSRFMGFPDTVTVQFIGLNETTSTLAIYSRAHYGYRDFGVNQARIDAWLAALGLPAAS
jgi:uncharacterized protein (DUF1499 family)